MRDFTRKGHYMELTNLRARCLHKVCVLSVYQPAHQRDITLIFDILVCLSVADAYTKPLVWLIPKRVRIELLYIFTHLALSNRLYNVPSA